MAFPLNPCQSSTVGSEKQKREHGNRPFRRAIAASTPTNSASSVHLSLDIISSRSMDVLLYGMKEDISSQTSASEYRNVKSLNISKPAG